MSHDVFEEFDIEGLDRMVDTYKAPERPSLRGEARKLTPVVERIFATRPGLPTAEVRRILDAAHRAGPLPNKSTFNRELGRICETLRGKPAQSGRSNPPVRSDRRDRQVGVQRKTSAATASANAEVKSAAVGNPVNDISTSPVPAAVASLRPAVGAQHPLDLFAGKFSGKVFIYSGAIRAFFAAVEKSSANALLKQFANQVMADPDSRECLDKLHPGDRAILDAALALA